MQSPGRSVGRIRPSILTVFLRPCSLCPGGMNPGRVVVHGADARTLSEQGMVVVCFNAEGRIDTLASDDLRSEDFNGFRYQDDLANLIEYVAALDYVDETNIDLKSQSYGITMATDSVDRYPDLPTWFLVDGEGPPIGFVASYAAVMRATSPAIL